MSHVTYTIRISTTSINRKYLKWLYTKCCWHSVVLNEIISSCITSFHFVLWRKEVVIHEHSKLIDNLIALKWNIMNDKCFFISACMCAHTCAYVCVCLCWHAFTVECSLLCLHLVLCLLFILLNLIYKMLLI